MAKTDVDWERIEADYRAGVLSLREIAALHDGVNHVAIARRAKKDGWVRDLSGKIQARADELVTKQSVTAGVTAERAVSDRAIVEANAEVIAGIRLAHRGDIAKSRTLVMTLLAELEHQTEHRELYEQLGELMHSPDENGRDKLYDLYQKAMALGGRTSTMKALADSLKTLIALEREAYGIASETGGSEGAEGLAGAIEKARNRAKARV